MAALFIFAFMSLVAPVAQAQSLEFRQAVAQAASGDRDLLAFYRDRDFVGIWSNRDDRNRRNALLAAFERAADHGLPAGRYDASALEAQLRNAATPQDQARLEVAMSRLFLDYARDIQTGILTPSRIDPAMVREVPLRSQLGTLRAFSQSNPAVFLRALAPSAPEYTRLMGEKIRLERLLADGGWGPTVPGNKYERGDSGAGVVALRNRLIAMGYLGRTNTQTYDDTIFAAVQQFQLAHGLATDGTAGASTLAELNTPPERRLQSIIVAMERERWINRPRGERHIWVNLTDFTAKIIDNGVETFSTRSVVGARDRDRVTPEFSDVMEFMVINPSWYVPRSIITKEFLPKLQQNPNAVGNLIMTDNRGRVVDRSAVDFASFTEQTFPFAMREPPNQGNALGLVKFMFPNQYNIYLHDTPAKRLFGREVRAFSHGCVRLADPFDFAYALLARQTSNPQEVFAGHLRSGVERRVDLADPVPVHLVYRTAFTQADGRTQFRRDVYGRDGRIWNALAREGVVLRAVRS
ncbi:MAG: L,D-transpeptidase family protein [Yoonia sp.]|uniref:L,D-transpeptidase family protein n=1 Tax=Yoonia sp. TaxID=2212373 RepID=UPI003EF4522C